MYTRTIQLLLFLFILHISLGTARPSDKPNYNDANKTAYDNRPPYIYKRFDTVNIKIHAYDNLTQQSWITDHWPRVDEFSVLTVTGTTSPSGISLNPNVTITIELVGYDNITYTPKHVYSTRDTEDTSDDIVVPFFTAILLLDNGNVTDFQWDDGCKGYCNPNTQCVDDVCANKRYSRHGDICSSQVNVDCNIKIYLAWSGRDKDDIPCKSMASAPSNFKQVSVSPITTLGSGLWNDFIYRFTTNAPDPVSGAPT